MITKRTKGRPKRSSGDAGRDLLISAALELLRQPKIELNRKELAIKAGVTPALVTYYFHDQLSLIQAVAQPLIERYLADLRKILQGRAKLENKLRSLVILFLEISTTNGRALDGYIDLVKQTSSTEGGFLASASAELSTFFRHCEEANIFRKTEIAFSQTALWGICKTVAQTPALSVMLFGTGVSEAEVLDRQTTLIVDFLLHGLLQPKHEQPSA